MIWRYIDFRHSPSGRSFLLRIQDFHASEARQMKYTLQMYDMNVDLAWTSTLIIPYDPRDAQIERMMIDDDRCYFILRKYEEPYDVRAKKIRKAVYRSMFNGKAYVDVDVRYEFWRSNTDGSGKTMFGYKDKALEFLNMDVSDPSEILIAGFFEDSVARTMNIAFLSMDPRTLQVEELDTRAFPVEHFDQFDHALRSIGQSKDKVADPFNYLLINFIPQDDESTIVICEKYHRSTYYGSGATSYTSSDSYGDLFIIKVSQGGEVLWDIVVPKQIHFGMESKLDRTRNASYAWEMISSDLVLFFNDDERNLQTIKDMLIYDLRPYTAQPVVTQVVIHPDGTYERSSLTSLPKQRLMVRNSCRRIGDDRIFFIADGMDNYQFVSVPYHIEH